MERSKKFQTVSPASIASTQSFIKLVSSTSFIDLFFPKPNCPLTRKLLQLKVSRRPISNSLFNKFLENQKDGNWTVVVGLQCQFYRIFSEGAKRFILLPASLLLEIKTVNILPVMELLSLLHCCTKYFKTDCQRFKMYVYDFYLKDGFYANLNRHFL